MILTKKKIRMEKERIRERKTAESGNLLHDIFWQGTYFDGKKDLTLTPRQETGGKGKVLMKEEHYTVLRQPASEYLGHFTPESGSGVNIMLGLKEMVMKNGLLPCLKVVGSDATVVNTGHTNGAIALLENELGHRLIWLICLLHINELPVRHLFEWLDGPTSGDKSFKGPIGKLLKKAETFPIDEDFDPITDGEGIRVLPADVVKDLSRDQKYLYEIIMSIREGSVREVAATFKIGPLNHARWITLVSRICRLYLSLKHLPLDDNSLDNLKVLTHFCVTNYGPLWFSIKCEPLYKDGPAHVLESVKRVQLLSQPVKDIVIPVIQRNAFNAHPENIILAMLADTDPKVRERAVVKIKEIRNGAPFGNTNVRQFQPPKLNFDANEYYDLVDGNSNWTEPIIVAEMGSIQLERILKERLFIGSFENHTQSVERTVKVVSQASKAVVGQRRRDGHIRCVFSSRKKHPKSDSRKDLAGLVE